MTANEWNAAYPVGTPVRYFPVRGQADHMDTATRSEAWALGHGAVVVSVRGKSGGVAIEHLFPHPEEHAGIASK